MKASETPPRKIVTLTGNTHWLRYHELRKIAENNGIEKVCGMSQLLHLIQGMLVAEEAFAKYKNEMSAWLNNIERDCVRDLEKKIKQGRSGQWQVIPNR